MDSKKLRIVFMGTPGFAVASLRRLVEAGYNIVAVVTTPDKPAGRGLRLQQSAVKEYALSVGLPVLQPVKLKDPAFVEEFRALDADLGIVIAFRMLPEVIWAQPRMGTFNLHASLLPEYRGAAPINWAVINGDTHTGVTTFFLNAEIDKGDVIDRCEVAITPDDTAGTLHDKLMEVGAGLVTETVDRIAAGDALPQSQPAADSGLKPAPKIFKDDCRIDWVRNPAEIHNLIRGLSPYPAAWSAMRRTGADEEIAVKIFLSLPEFSIHENPHGEIFSDGRTFINVACRGGYISILELQAAGKKRMPVEEFLRGFKEIQNYRFV